MGTRSPIHRRLAMALMLAALALPGPMKASSGFHPTAVPLDGWTHQRFAFFGGNDWIQTGSAIELRSEGAVSLLWRTVPPEAWDAKGMRWRWRVTETVPPTRLDVKGGDDRNLSVYAVFLPRDIARTTGGRGAGSLLEERAARVLMYVWGGDHSRGDRLDSAYLGPRGKTLVMRPAQPGDHRESVDFAADLRRAFGRSDDLVLVALAISGDSDDSGSRITATLSDLTLF